MKKRKVVSYSSVWQASVALSPAVHRAMLLATHHAERVAAFATQACLDLEAVQISVATHAFVNLI